MVITDRAPSVGGSVADELEIQAEHARGHSDLEEAGVKVPLPPIKSFLRPETLDLSHMKNVGEFDSSMFPQYKLSNASFFGKDVIIEKLLDAGVDVNGKEEHWLPTDKLHNSPLHWAVMGENDHCVKLLVKRGAKVDICNTYGETPLHMACLKGYIPSVDVLLQYTEDVNKADGRMGSTALHNACGAGHGEVVLLLLQAGADPGIADNDGMMPLHYSICNEHTMHPIDCLDILLDSGVSIDQRAKDHQTWMGDTVGSSPLHLAVQFGRHGMAEYLIRKRGAKVNKSGGYGGRTPLHIACVSGDVRMVTMLLKAGADLEVKDRDGYTPLYYAIKYKHEDCTVLMLDSGSSLQTRLHDACPTFHAALLNKEHHVARRYLDEGCLVSATERHRSTPPPTRGLNQEVDKALDEAGASLSLEDDDALSSLELAMKHVCDLASLKWLGIVDTLVRMDGGLLPATKETAEYGSGLVSSHRTEAKEALGLLILSRLASNSHMHQFVQEMFDVILWYDDNRLKKSPVVTGYVVEIIYGLSAFQCCLTRLSEPMAIERICALAELPGGLDPCAHILKRVAMQSLEHLQLVNMYGGGYWIIQHGLTPMPEKPYKMRGAFKFLGPIGMHNIVRECELLPVGKVTEAGVLKQGKPDDFKSKGLFGEIRPCKVHGKSEIFSVETIKAGSGYTKEDIAGAVNAMVVCNHPHIEAFLGASFEAHYTNIKDPSGFFVSESLPSVGSFIRKDLWKKKDYRKTVLMAAGVASGMDHLHRLGLLHMAFDIDCALYCEKNNYGKITRYYPHPQKENWTHATKDPALYRYMAPELNSSRNRVYTTKTDVFAFGIVLIEAYCGELAWSKASRLQIMDKIKSGTRPDVPLDCPRPLQHLIVRCIHQNPAERPEFAQIVGELVSICAGATSGGLR